MKLMSMKPQFCYVHPKLYPNKVKNSKQSVQTKSSQNSSQRKQRQKSLKSQQKLIDFRQTQSTTILSGVQQDKLLAFTHQSHQVFDRIEKTYITINLLLIQPLSSGKNLPKDSLKKQDRIREQQQNLSSFELTPQYASSPNRRQSPPWWSQSVKQLKSSTKC